MDPDQPKAGTMDAEIKQSWHHMQQRYCAMVLIVAAVTAGALIFMGYLSLGKGLVLGAVFSTLNFTAMAIMLPMQFNPQRRKGTLVSLGSILLRYSLMAIPLIIALRSPRIALSTVIIGLFGIQISILGDHLWARLRDTMGTRF
jgi:hypothetical protein